MEELPRIHIRNISTLPRCRADSGVGHLCGHQLIALCYGGTVAPIRGTMTGDSYKGMFRQRGFTDVSSMTEASIFAVLPHLFRVGKSCRGGENASVRASSRATNPESHVQAFIHISRPIIGVQFHPDRNDEAHPAGARILRNFLGLP